ncbi:unnamed protein product [Effrenium voratum]|nr:unnamed protein product [Effrenium voratum]
MTGYFGLVERMHAKGVLGDYEFHGCRRFDVKTQQSAMVMALAAYVPESFLFELMRDARVARRQQTLRSVMSDEFAFLDHLPLAVWNYLAGAVSLTPRMLRDQVLSAAAVAESFIHWRVLRVAGDLPWSLCAGDPAANLKRLLAEDAPDEPVSLKIYQLGMAGYNTERLTRVELLGECSWTSAFVEKQHASTSRVKKFHPDIGDNALLARAFCFTFAELLESDLRD